MYYTTCRESTCYYKNNEKINLVLSGLSKDKTIEENTYLEYEQDKIKFATM